MTILPSRFMFVKKKEKRCIMAHLAPARASPYALYYPVYIPEQYDVTTWPVPRDLYLTKRGFWIKSLVGGSYSLLYH